MKAPRTRAAAAPRPPRRWRTPPPLTRGSSESLEGMDILREVGGDAGILLWQSYRNVMLWATAEPAERGRMFSAEAGRKRLADVVASELPAELSDPLATVGRMLGAPGETPGQAVADACAAIAIWAEVHGHSGAALAFTQAAALAAPNVARLPFDVGQIARRRHELARAETWFRHAIMIGRQVADWDSYSRSYLALGNMFLLRGNLPTAQRMHVKALRAARRKGLPHIQGYALHDLFVIATLTGRNEQAELYARSAFRAYGAHHEKVPALAHDIAYFWMNQGYFERALPVFQALQPHFSDLRDQMNALANTARAAGGAGMRDVFRKTWVEAMRLGREAAVVPVLAEAMVELATGAASLGEWDRAEQSAERALELAKQRGEHKVAARAEAILDSARRGRHVEAARAATRGGEQMDQADALAEDLVRSLEAQPVGV
jgi:tetratricopeptide (TPR) repeat protein